VCVLLSLSCGYRGPIYPPSPELPVAITDLAAIERGNRLVITFSAPTRTTDDLAIKRFSEIDLRIGPAPVPFDFGRWAAAAAQFQLNPPPPNDPDDPKPALMTDSIPISEWLGQRIAVAVRTAVKKTGHYSQWSNRVVLEVIPPLQPPDASAKATSQGVRLSWPSQGSEMHYRVLRKGPADKTPVEVGTAEKNEYLDTTAQYDTHYEYSVVAAETTAESLPSKSVDITPIDIFAPSVPTGVTALATPESIEVSWQRSPESDLKGYYVYRSVSGGPFVRMGDLLTLPVYSDHSVEHGKTYRYAVSSIDQKGNESEKSAPPVEVGF
ncbi:MAG: hypothetical protein WB992_19900, partial [Bryobacteraceae bacterium]